MKLRNLCVVFSALTTLAFTAPAFSQGTYQDTKKIVKQKVIEEAQPLTRKELTETFFIVAINYFKTKKDVKQIVEEDAGISFKRVVKAITGKDDQTTVDETYKLFKEDLARDKGENAYVVKKVAYPKAVLEDYLKVIDSSSTKEFETIVMSGDNPRELGYRKSLPGLEIYLIRADSKEEAIKESKEFSEKPVFRAYGNTIMMTPEELKEYDTIYTDAIKDPVSNIRTALDMIGM